MSEADKLFEELGYKKSIQNSGDIYYFQHNGTGESYGILFEKNDKDIYPVCYGKEDNLAIYISMQELKAINMKCKELGWE